MALDKEGLKGAIKAAMNANISAPTAKQDKEVDAIASAIADAVDTYIKGIEITYTTGLVAPSGGGPVSGVFEYTIS